MSVHGTSRETLAFEELLELATGVGEWFDRKVGMMMGQAIAGGMLWVLLYSLWLGVAARIPWNTLLACELEMMDAIARQDTPSCHQTLKEITTFR